MKTLIALLMLVSLPALACRCDFKAVRAAVEKPSLAELYFVGKLTEASSQGQLVFDVTQSFKGTSKGKLSFKTSASSTCSLAGLKVGVEYRVISVKDLSSPGDFTICDTSIEAAVAKK